MVLGDLLFMFGKYNQRNRKVQIILHFRWFELFSHHKTEYIINNMELNFHGVIIGVATFLVIGLFHPLVIKGEYYLGVKCWWLFLLMGLATLAASLLVQNSDLSILFGVVAFSSFWSIGEVFEQRKRVDKGWFPANPKRKKR